MIKYKSISLLMVICYLIGINNMIESNDTIYIPKAKRGKMDKWLTRLNVCVYTMAEILESALRTTRRKVQRSSKRSTSILYPKRKAVIMSAMALQTQIGTHTNTVRFDTDSAMVGIDNRCTACISHFAQDFIGPLIDSKRSIKGFGGSKTTGVKMGTIVWKWEDNEGKISKFTIPNSYYVPQGKVRLLSPQHWAKVQQTNNKKSDNKYHGTISQTTAEDVTLMWNNRKSKLTVPLSRDSNVATFHLAPGYNSYTEFCMNAELSNDNEIIISDERPLTPKEVDSPTGVWSKDLHAKFLNGPVKKTTEEQVPEYDFDIDVTEDRSKEDDGDNTSLELLRIHHRFVHISFKKLQHMAKQGVIPKKYATCDVPVCAACVYGKMIRKKWRNKPMNTYDMEPLEAKAAGELVAVDQMVSPTPGFIAQITGRLTTKRYKYATIFVDIATRYGYVHLQKSPDTQETVEGKMAFETHLRPMGVKVKAYHADNGIFKAHGWVKACKDNMQNLTFAGVNAHHQNGYEERRIRELQELARSMLIHANRKWPKSISTNLWPYALRLANDMYNISPCFQLKDNVSPLQSISGSDVSINQKHYRPFGCPAFVLNNALQQNKPYSKWNERARVGIYIGKSPHHDRNVALILNRETGLVSPQFHVLYDERFHTVTNDEFDSNRKVKAGLVTNIDKRAVNKENGLVRQKEFTGIDSAKITHPSEGGKDPTTDGNVRKRPLISSGSDKSMHENENEKRKRTQPLSVSWDHTTTTLTADGRRRSGRLNPSLVPAQKLISLQASLMNNTPSQVPGEIFCMEAIESCDTNEYDNPMICKATTDPDTMYMHEAMREHDRNKFIDAMEKEVRDQVENGNFTIVHRDDVPADQTILPAVWQMKRKRDIRTRDIKKYKARLNIDGSRMKKVVHYDQTYAPVASWNSIRVLLAMVAAWGWHTKQIDYVLAFPQAPVEKEIYMRIPKGFEVDGNNHDHVLKVNRNVYGQKQAGRVWNKFLEGKLVNELNFTQSTVDECVFYRGKTMYVLYTDDSILAGPDEAEIQKIIEDIRGIGLNITEEGDIQDFLGINISKMEDGKIHLSQPHLIDQILKDLKMNVPNLKLKQTPCKSSAILKANAAGKPFDNSFHYRSIIGKLNYLEKGSRSDISYITHQCARYTEQPMDNHARAIRWLAKYLKGTRDKGFTMTPDITKGIEVFVDADFAGNWDRDNSLHPDTARSRHGYIVKFLNCPIIWKSQLQTEIALSSSESEYTGLSYALKEVIPVMNLINEMTEKGFVVKQGAPNIYCEVFEDNSGALEMANIHKYRPRTKHLNVKLHHFRKYVNDGSIKIRKIDTGEQQADYLTKPLSEDRLRYLRKQVMGW